MLNVLVMEDAYRADGGPLDATEEPALRRC
jgi:hypothetical protein